MITIKIFFRRPGIVGTYRFNTLDDKTARDILRLATLTTIDSVEKVTVEDAFGLQRFPGLKSFRCYAREIRSLFP